MSYVMLLISLVKCPVVPKLSRALANMVAVLGSSTVAISV